MRIALCISGLCHGFEEAIPFLRANLIDTLQPDVFIHTWNISGARTLDAINTKALPQSTRELIAESFRPIDAVFEPFREFDGSLYRDRCECNAASALSMFYKIRECNRLKSAHEREQGFTYDVVIRCRFDMRLESPVRVEDLVDLNQWLYGPDAWNWGGINDQFAFSSSSNMDVYAGIFDSIDEYWQRGGLFNPEKLLQYHLEDRLIPCRKIHLRYALVGSPHPSSQETWGGEADADGLAKAWLVEFDFSEFPTIRVARVAFYVVLTALSLKGRWRARERFIFLIPPPPSPEARLSMANQVFRFWFCSGLAPRNRYSLEYCDPEERPVRIEKTAEFYWKQEIPFDTANKLDLSNLVSRLVPIALLIMRRLAQLAWRVVKRPFTAE